MIEKLTAKIIQWRWMVTAATLGAVVLATAGIRGIYFESDYRIYFPEDNPQRVAHEDMQRMFANLLQLSCYLDEVKISSYI
jgi:predicted RND superfamily exporter protein